MNNNNVVFDGNLTFDNNAQEWSIFKERFGWMCFANELTDTSNKAGTKRRTSYDICGRNLPGRSRFGVSKDTEHH